MRLLLLPELDVAPLDGDRAFPACGPVRADLVVEGTAAAVDGVLQRAVDIHPQRLADDVHGVYPDRRTHGDVRRDRLAVVHRVEPTALLDAEQEERPARLEGLLEA